MSEWQSLFLAHPSALASSGLSEFPACETEHRQVPDDISRFLAEGSPSETDASDIHQAGQYLPAFEAVDPDSLQDLPGGSVPAGRARPKEQCYSADDGQLAVWIVRVAESRDQGALRSLYDASVTRVHSVVLRMLRRSAWAEEVVEDTYFQVWRQAPRFDPMRGRAGGWLMAMARSRAIDAWRRESRFDHASLDCDEAIDVRHGGPSHDDLLACSRNHQRLHDAIASLPAQRRQLVALAFLRGCSHEEIAQHMALPLGTVKSQIRRTLVSLRQTLCDQHQQGSVGGLAASGKS